MRTLAERTSAWGYDAYDAAWRAAARAGIARVALDTRMFGWRYLSLNGLILTPAEVRDLRRLTEHFGRLIEVATGRVLDDPAWWSELAWPWPAIELARQEPTQPATLYGRLDWLFDLDNTWQLVEYNADMPSGGRETAALDPAVWRLHGGRGSGLRPLGGTLERRLSQALHDRLTTWSSAVRPIECVGVVSSHSWLEDMSQAWWLTGLLRQAGWNAVVGGVSDLSVQDNRVSLRGRQIQALYRFYPVERLYRHGIFGPLLDAALERQVLLLNGLRAFLAQSKAVLAWLWANRADACLGRGARRLIEAHLPPILPARDASARRLLPDAVVKHVNGREGDSVVFADGLNLDGAAWEKRLLEGGYVVQRRVHSRAVEDIEVDELAQQVRCVAPRFACVGAFCIGGRFGGCYTRLDGPITTARATFVPTLLATDAPGP